MKRILISAVYYPPSQQIGAKRPSKMAKFLSESGWDVTVLTVDPVLTPPTALEDLDSERMTETITIVRTKAFVPYVWAQNRISRNQIRNSRVAPKTTPDHLRSNGVLGKIRQIRNSIARKLITLFDSIDEWSGWEIYALRAIRKSGLKFDVVLSTIPPHSTAKLGMKLAAHFKCKFVLDYRDPWSEIAHFRLSSHENVSKRIQRQKRIEDECLEAADLIFTVSPAISAMLTKRVVNDIHTVPQGFSGEVARRSIDRKSMYVLYAGSLAYERDLSPVFLAMEQVEKICGKKLKLVYCGPNSDLAHEQAISVGADRYLDTKGSVGEPEVFEYATRALCNLVVVSPGYEYSYPGKLFDLIPAGRPIYVVSQKMSEAGILVEKFDIGYSIADAGVHVLAERLKGEIERDFSMPAKVGDLKVENIYRRMLEEGLNTLER